MDQINRQGRVGVISLDSSGGGEDAVVALAHALADQFRCGKIVCVDCTGFLTPLLLRESEQRTSCSMDAAAVHNSHVPAGVSGILSLLQQGVALSSASEDQLFDLAVEVPSSPGLLTLPNGPNMECVHKHLLGNNGGWSWAVISALCDVLDKCFKHTQVLIALPPSLESPSAIMGMFATDRLIAAGSSSAVSARNLRRLLARIYDDENCRTEAVAMPYFSHKLSSDLIAAGAQPLFAGCLILDAEGTGDTEDQVDKCVNDELNPSKTPLAMNTNTLRLPARFGEIQRSVREGNIRLSRQQKRLLCAVASDGKRKRLSPVAKAIAVVQQTTLALLAVIAVVLTKVIIQS